MKKLFFLLALLLPVSAIAELYKWTDANGHVQFSDQKPSHAGKVEKIATPPAPSSPADTGTNPAGKSPGDSLAERQKKISDVLKAEREQGEAEAARVAEQKAAKKRRCLSLLDYRKSAEGGRLYNLDDKGERKYMSDNDKAQRLSALDREITATCQP